MCVICKKKQELLTKTGQWFGKDGQPAIEGNKVDAYFQPVHPDHDRYAGPPNGRPQGPMQPGQRMPGQMDRRQGLSQPPGVGGMPRHGSMPPQGGMPRQGEHLSNPFGATSMGMDAPPGGVGCRVSQPGVSHHSVPSFSFT